MNITYCMNPNCDRMDCDQNPKHIQRFDLPISLRQFDGTEYCVKREED